jgi:hypothetical protein
MYSPKVREKYVPVLYRMGQRRGVPMTRLVEEALDSYLTQHGLIDEVRAEAMRRRHGGNPAGSTLDPHDASIHGIAWQAA